MTNGESRRTKLIWLVIGMVISLVGSAIFSFWIVPYVTDKPEIELIIVEPKLFNKGSLIELNATLENTGKRTAGDLLIFINEHTERGPFKSDYKSETITGTPSFLQAGDIFNAIVSLEAPEKNQSYWIIQLWVTTTDGYSWTFNIIYEFLTDTHQYHLLS